MIYKNYNPVNIREALMSEVKRLGVSKNVFPQSRPKAYDKMNDFVVVKVSSGVRDDNAYGDTICRVELYAKCRQNEIENEAKMKSMIEKMESFQPRIGPYHLSPNSILPLGNDGYGFSMTAIIITTIVERVN